MTFICTSMPADMRHLLFPKLVASLGGSECVVCVDDSRVGVEPFECIHFSWYNRYTSEVSAVQLFVSAISKLYPQGDDAPQDAHPHMLRCGDGSVINITQLTPYQCCDVEKYGQLYDSPMIGFKDVFTWIHEMVSFTH